MPQRPRLSPEAEALLQRLQPSLLPNVRPPARGAGNAAWAFVDEALAPYQAPPPPPAPEPVGAAQPEDRGIMDMVSGAIERAQSVLGGPGQAIAAGHRANMPTPEAFTSGIRAAYNVPRPAADPGDVFGAISDVELATREVTPGEMSRDAPAILNRNIVRGLREVVGQARELIGEPLTFLARVQQGDRQAVQQLSEAVAGAAQRLQESIPERLQQGAEELAGRTAGDLRMQDLVDNFASPGDLAKRALESLDEAGREFVGRTPDVVRQEREQAMEEHIARGPTIGPEPERGFIGRRVENIQDIGDAVNGVVGQLIDLGMDPAGTGQWVFEHPVETAMVADAVRAVPGLLRAFTRGTLTDEMVSEAADAAGVSDDAMRKALPRQLPRAPREVEEAAERAQRAAEGGPAPLSRQLPPAPAEAELRSTRAAGPLVRDARVQLDEAGRVPGAGTQMQDDIIGRARREAQEAMEGSAREPVGELPDEATEFPFGQAARPEPAREISYPDMDLQTTRRLSTGLGGQVANPTPLDRFRGLVDEGGMLTPAGRQEMRGQARRRLVDRGVPDETADELMRILDEVDQQGSAVRGASDVSVEQAVFESPPPLTREFLERGGVDLKDAPRRLRQRVAKRAGYGGGVSGVDEFESLPANLSEAEVVEILMGPAPSRLQTQRVAQAFQDLGLADNAGDALTMARLFDPNKPGVAVRAILAGKSNQTFRNLVDFAEARVSLTRMAQEAAESSAPAGRTGAEGSFGASPKDYLLHYARAFGAKESDQVPAWVRGTDADSTLQLVDQIVGNAKPPIEAAMRRSRPAAWWRQTVQSRAKGAGMEQEHVERLSWALTGSRSLPDDVGQLKLIARQIDDIRSGKMPVAADAATLRELRRQYGPGRFQAPAPKAGEVIAREGAPGAPGAPPGSSGFVSSLQAGPAHLGDTRDINVVQMILRDADKNIPELRPILGPAFDAYHKATYGYAERLAGVFQGLKNTSEEVWHVTKVLTGQYGDEEAIFGNPRILEGAAGLSPETAAMVAGIAREVRTIEDELFVLLKYGLDGKGGPIPNLQRRPHHLSFLREHYWNKEYMPADLMRYTDRGFWFRFMKRMSDEIPDDINVMDSLRAYIPAALRQVHMNPAFPMLDELRATLGKRGHANRVELLDMVEDMVTGRKVGYEAALNRDILRTHRSVQNSPVGRFLGLDKIAPTDAERLSMMISTNFYRGILGLNMSAAVNNATQAINTMADVGVLRTLQGAATMLTPTGRAAARRVDLDRQFSRIFEHNYRFGSATKKLDDIIFAPFQQVEFFNRGTAFHAGASAALARGASTRKAIQVGIETAGRTQFYYDEIGRAPFWRTPLGRTMGVLTSFPIKQAEFIKEMATSNRTMVGDLQVPGGGLYRYLMVMGLASAIGEDVIGVRLNALSRRPIPGTDLELPGFDFLAQFEGGIPAMQSPTAQAGKALAAFFTASADGDPLTAMDRFGDFLDHATNAIPASVQAKEALNALTAASRGERRQSITHWPFLKETRQDKPGGLVQKTSWPQEIQRLFGAEDVEQVQERDIMRAAARHSQQAKARAAREADLAFARVARGDTAGAAELIGRGNVSFQQLRSRFGVQHQTQLERVLRQMGDVERKRFIEENPEVIDIFMRGRR